MMNTLITVRFSQLCFFCRSEKQAMIVEMGKVVPAGTGPKNRVGTGPAKPAGLCRFKIFFI
jgi:hypothetical protein